MLHRAVAATVAAARRASAARRAMLPSQRATVVGGGAAAALVWSTWQPASTRADTSGEHQDRRATVDSAAQATVIGQHRAQITTLDKGKLVVEDATWAERLRFRVDDYLSSSVYPRLSILGTSTGVLLGVATVSFWRFSGVEMAFREAVWTAWTTIADPGTHTLTPSGQGRMRSVGVVFTLGGLFFFALLIGLVNDGIESCRPCELSKAQCPVSMPVLRLLLVAVH